LLVLFFFLRLHVQLLWITPIMPPATGPADSRSFLGVCLTVEPHHGSQQSPEARVAQLEQLNEQLRRGGQTSGGAVLQRSPKSKPKKPGRRRGSDHGTHHRRPIPPKIDETHEAPLPPACPKCGCGQIEQTDVQQQYQVEIPIKPIHRQFNVRIGRDRLAYPAAAHDGPPCR
jgi:hypothetical protein